MRSHSSREVIKLLEEDGGDELLSNPAKRLEGTPGDYRKAARTTPLPLDDLSWNHLAETCVKGLTACCDRAEAACGVRHRPHKTGGGGPHLTLYKVAERDALYAGSRFSASARARWRGHPSEKQG